MRLTLVLLMAVALAAPADAAAVKFNSKLLISHYKKACNANIAALKARLKKEKVMIHGSRSQAATSPELACNFAADNPTMKKLNDEAWVAETAAYIAKVGVARYAVGARAATAEAMAKGGIVQLLAKARVEGLTPVEISVIGQMTRAAAFTEAHIQAAEKAFGKK
jgi:hypothetical protein